MDCPVTEVNFQWYRIKLQYGFWNIKQEVFVVIAGPLSCTFLFLFMIQVIRLSQNYIQCFPRGLSKAIAWFGFFTIFDFFLVAILDFASQDNSGDLFKLYNYFDKQDGSGFIGYFVTFIIQLFLVLINLFLFYYYIVFVHHEQKISDIYLRISGKGRDYFLPDDTELSYRCLKH
mmetsp:Transcript_8543/g.13190  ORF Transcript_8543/g.13190 Transcript_8543/m.13190 type:complete len:174 (+) Transcript_8543:2377-2898(+)